MNFELIREIGHGGMGKVYYGKRCSDGKECAIKCMLAQYVSNPDYRAFFDSEAKAMKSLDHPSVVKIMGDTYSDISGNLYLPMEFIEGETIKQRIERQQAPFSESEAVEIMVKVLDAFSYIHSQGQIHRDIKPSNIMLRPDGRICVIDFGIAKDMRTSTGKTIGRQVGTKGYMSPEQIKALSIDHRTDIYSLGCLLFYMLTGQHAIKDKSNSFETELAITNDDFPSARAINPQLSDHIERIIYKATDKDMRRRYQSAQEFANALRNNTTRTNHADHTLPLESGYGDYALSHIPIGKWTVTVGRKGQDINIDDMVVSSYHLDIVLETEVSTGSTTVRLTVVDHSTNGTGVNGIYVHNGSLLLDYNPFATYTQQMPTILLAGKKDFQVNWSQVETLFKERALAYTPPLPTPSDEPQGKVAADATSQSSMIGIGVLSFIVPLIGLALYFVYKAEEKEKSKIAEKAGVWGFVFWFVLAQIIKIL